MLSSMSSTRWPRHLPHEGQPLGDGLVRHRGDRLGADDSGRHLPVDADDVGFPGGDREDPAPTAADEDRRVRPLRRLRLAVVVRDRVVRALERERAVAHRALDDGDGFFQPVDAHARAVVRNARAAVVGLHPAGADADVDPAVAQHVHRRQLLRQDDGVLVVVVEDERADAQRRRGGGRRGERGHRRQLIREVIRHRDRRRTRGPRSCGPARPSSWRPAALRSARRSGTGGSTGPASRDASDDRPGGTATARRGCHHRSEGGR